MIGALAALLIAGAGQVADRQALVGATLIDGDGRVVEESVILIEGSRIACAGTRRDCPLPPAMEAHDLSGSYITPGLIDGHVHFDQSGWIDARPDGLAVPGLYPQDRIQTGLRDHPERWHRAYLCSGITAVFDVGGPMWTIKGAQGDDPERSDRVHVRAAGPLITHADVQDPGNPFNPFLPMDSEDQIRIDVARLAEAGTSAIKVWYLDPPAERVDELDALLTVVGEAAHAAGLPLIVHATELRNAKAALRAGADMLVHSVWDGPVDDEFLQMLQANDAWYAPTMVVDRNWSRAIENIANERATEVDDPGRCVDEVTMMHLREVGAIMAEVGAGKVPDAAEQARRAYQAGKQRAYMEHNLIAVRDAGGKIVLSTDAGNPLTFHGTSILWEMEAMEDAGLSPSEVLRSGTIEAASAMGMENEIGSLLPGKVADLIVLAEDPRATVRAYRSLTHVMRAGELKTQKELQVR